MAVLLSGARAEPQCAVGVRAPKAGMQEPAELRLEDGPRDVRKGSVLSAGQDSGNVAVSPPGIHFFSTERELG